MTLNHSKLFLPCCIRDPIVNHKLFTIENWFSTIPESGLHGCGFCHSYGLKRARKNIIKLTTRYAAIIYNQISTDRGERNANRLGGFLSGRLYKMLIPKLRNGFVKSITCSRWKLIVKPATPKSAFF